MAGRFSDIKRGGELNKKLTKYVAYLQNPPARRLNSQGDRDPSSPVYLTPFSLDIGTTQVVSVDANDKGYALLAPFVNQGTGSEITNAKGAKTVKDVGRFRAAKVNVFQNATKVKSTPNSKFTGEPYLKYTGTSYSCPFGRKAATDDIQDAYADIRSIIRARPGFEVNRVSLQIERVYAS
jgi:hypothetical protein